MLERILELNAAKTDSRKERCLSTSCGGESKQLSWECLHLSDAMEEPEEVHRELRRLLQTEMVVRTAAHDSFLKSRSRCAQVPWPQRKWAAPRKLEFVSRAHTLADDSSYALHSH